MPSVSNGLEAIEALDGDIESRPGSDGCSDAGDERIRSNT